MKKALAIVIPAYKGMFFEETIASIANQTCKDFTLYIGDDSSPDNLFAYVEPYQSMVSIVYHRFTDNIGGKDLIAHWSRCISLTKNEEWVWLFSDDDVMDINCVEKFYEFIHKSPESNLLHFNLKIINQFGKELKKVPEFPMHVTADSFFERRIKNKINSTVVEYIFKKKIYLDEGFKSYDLAWCSDDATWIKFAKYSGIETITGSFVKWRYSGSNISSIVSDKETIYRKLESNIAHIKWVKSYFNQNYIEDNTSEFAKFKWIVSVFLSTTVFSSEEKFSLTFKVIKELEYKNISYMALILLFYMQFKLLINRIKVIRRSSYPY